MTSSRCKWTSQCLWKRKSHDWATFQLRKTCRARGIPPPPPTYRLHFLSTHHRSKVAMSHLLLRSYTPHQDSERRPLQDDRAAHNRRPPVPPEEDSQAFEDRRGSLSSRGRRTQCVSYCRDGHFRGGGISSTSKVRLGRTTTPTTAMTPSCSASMFKTSSNRGSFFAFMSFY